jgi:hypothetical protein
MPLASALANPAGLELEEPLSKHCIAVAAATNGTPELFTVDAGALE